MYAAADAAHNDEHGQRHENKAVDNTLNGTAQEVAENFAAGQAIGAEAGTEQIADVQNGVLDAVAAQCAVEEQDEEGGQDAQPAHPLELLGQSLVRAHGAVTGLAADGQLAHHNDEAAQDRQDQIDDEEREAAGGTHLIGEAPDVAQADCRADRGHQEPKIGSKAFSFFHCFLSLTDFCSYVDTGADKFCRALSIDRKRHGAPPCPAGISSRDKIPSRLPEKSIQETLSARN